MYFLNTKIALEANKFCRSINALELVWPCKTVWLFTSLNSLSKKFSVSIKEFVQ